MNPQQRNFLKIISAALTGYTLDLQGGQLEQDWTALHRIGSQQKLLSIPGHFPSPVRR